MRGPRISRRQASRAVCLDCVRMYVESSLAFNGALYLAVVRIQSTSLMARRCPCDPLLHRLGACPRAGSVASRVVLLVTWGTANHDVWRGRRVRSAPNGRTPPCTRLPKRTCANVPRLRTQQTQANGTARAFVSRAPYGARDSPFAVSSNRPWSRTSLRPSGRAARCVTRVPTMREAVRGIVWLQARYQHGNNVHAHGLGVL